jgi:hypothetical protein
MQRRSFCRAGIVSLLILSSACQSGLPRFLVEARINGKNQAGTIVYEHNNHKNQALKKIKNFCSNENFTIIEQGKMVFERPILSEICPSHPDFNKKINICIEKEEYLSNYVNFVCE